MIYVIGTLGFFLYLRSDTLVEDPYKLLLSMFHARMRSLHLIDVKTIQDLLLGTLTWE